MPNSKQIVYLSQTQYAELIANGTITVDGVTVTYDENDIYVTPQAEPVTDVRVNGTSIAANGVANIPLSKLNTFGVLRAQTDRGINYMSEGVIQISSANGVVKAGTNMWRPVVPTIQHESTFYGLAKAAGHDEKDSTEPLGTYTPEAKGAIQSMLGVSDLIATAENSLVASKAYAIGDVFTANGKLYKATAAIAADAAIITDGANANAVETSVGEGFPHDVQVNGVSVVQNGVANVPVGSNANYGVYKLSTSNSLSIDSNGGLGVTLAVTSQIKEGLTKGRLIAPSNQHESTFYGLAKAAGADEKDSTLSVGQYTETAKTAIRSMIGATSSNVIAVQDTQPTDTDTKIWLPETAETPVQIPTMDDLGNYVQKTDIASESQAGIVKSNLEFGIGINFNSQLYLNRAELSQIKAGRDLYRPIVPNEQHESVFYGLAKAAGDVTQAASSNAVGTYTDNAKVSIKSMLGIVDGSTGTVDVSGTTPTIAAVENTRYVCGEVTSLDFTPAASGICIVRFTSGSTVTVLTLPSTVKFPEWFDPTTLETNTTYEICITDGVYGAVMSWAQ